MYTCIAVATDGSEIAERAVEHALALAKDTGAEIAFLSVVDSRVPALVPPGPPPAVTAYYASVREAMFDKVDALLAELVGRAHAMGVTASSQTLEGTPAPVLVKAASELGADLIVMGTHGRTGLTALLMGSTAQAVLHGTKTPVLLVH